MAKTMVAKIRAAKIRAAKIMVLHGPNLNLLGTREPDIYGTDTLETINERLHAQISASGNEVQCYQSNAEHALIDQIHAAKAAEVSYIIINPGAFTHTSIALRDALLSVSIPFVEVHLSNVYSREEFRHHSCLADIATGCITGLGAMGYQLAAEFVLSQLP